MFPSILPTYNRAPLAFVSGSGSWLMTDDERQFLDLGAGIAVNSLGHAHPALVAALTDQAGQLWHTSNLYEIPSQKKLADQLVNLTFADTVFLQILVQRLVNWPSKWRENTFLIKEKWNELKSSLLMDHFTVVLRQV